MYIPALLYPPTPILHEENWPLVRRTTICLFLGQFTYHNFIYFTQLDVGKDIFESTETMLAASAPAEIEEEIVILNHVPGFDDDLMPAAVL